MYEALTKDQGTGRQNFADWKEAWSSTEKSENSPKQGNGYDCGIFTLISMGLLRNGHILRSDSYFQNTLYQRHSREKLAWTIWKTGRGSDAVQWQPGSHGQNTAPKSKRGARREIPTGGCRKKKRQKEGRLIPGSAKMQSLIKWYVNEQTNPAGFGRTIRSVEPIF